MSTLTRWNPARDMAALRNEMDCVFADSVLGPPPLWNLSGEEVHLDVYEEGNNLVVNASVPAVKPEELNVQIENDILTISGETKRDEEHKEQDYYLRERRYGRFSRSLELPRAVNAEQADAVFANGVLTLTLPKADEARGKQIKIKTK
ncbi:MAG TPA: Hsp20/alpha crystallin family protein [Anaerolineae bacterium]